MVDLLGPGNADNAVTTRPGRVITRGGADTWLKDCSTADANDGTALVADLFNDTLAQLRVALRNSGIALDGADDMLWRAMQSIGIRYGVDTGAVNALTCDFTPDVAALTDGLMLLVKVGHDNSGAVTLLADAQLAKPVVWPDGTALTGGMIKAGMLLLVAYVGGSFQILSRTQPPQVSGSGFAVGQIVMSPLDTPLGGTLLCDGSAVLRATYPNLFAFLGTKYGAGNGTTTFNLPNYSGMFLRGAALGAGADPDAAARTNRGDGTAGDHVGTRQADGLGTHAHGFTGGAVSGSVSGTIGGTVNLNFVGSSAVDPGGTPLGGVSGAIVAAGAVAGPPQGTDVASNHDIAAQINGVGISGGSVSGSVSGTVSGTVAAAGGAETRPKNVSINYCIAY